MPTREETIVDLLETVIADPEATRTLPGAQAALALQATLAARLADHPAYAPLWTQYQADPQGQQPVLVGILQVILRTDPDLARQVEDLLARYQEIRHVTASGERNIAAGGDIRDNTITMGNAVNTGGGTYVGAGVDVQNGDFVGGNQTKVYHAPPGADPATLHAAYLRHLLAMAGQLSLSGIDPKAASEREAQLSLSAVYTGLVTLTPEECARMQDGACRPEELERGARRQSVVEQLDRHAKLVLLGDPGSGKTTFVNFVTLCLAGERLARSGVPGPETALPDLARLTEPLPQEESQLQPWRHGALLPVRVILRDFAARGLPEAGQRATARHLWDFIVAELEAATLGEFAPHLKETLQQEGGLILLDGLDEVPEAEARREQIKQAVTSFAGAFGTCRILVTSRTYAYQQQAWRLPNFAEAVLAPFEAGQIARFVDRWYEHIAHLRGLHPQDAAGRAELLRRAIEQSPRLQGLAARPLLLTLMASLHAWRGGSLPEKREELYADAVDLLLDWWEQPKVVRHREQVIVEQPSLREWLRVKEREQVRKLLERLAYQAHAGQPDLVGTADVAEGDLLSGLLRLSQNPDVNPAQLVAYLSTRAGLLLPRGVGVYTFPHRTFQEYLAACYLTDADYPDAVAELAREEPNRWREVALLAGAKAARGTASAVWALADALCFRDPPEPLPEADAWGALLAGQALVESAELDEVSPRNRAKVQRVQAHLAQLLAEGTLPAVERVAAGVLLAQLGDPRPGVGLRADGLPDVAWIEIPAGPFLMGSSDEDEEAFDSEKPQHQIEMPEAYRISRYPVTQTQYGAFVQAGGYRERRYWTEAGWAWRERRAVTGLEEYGEPFDLPNHPVVGVSWYAAVAYCRWLTEALRECGELSADQEVRLPSEAEWEKAARGGLPSERIYPWGADADPERANYAETGIGSTSAVGAFPGGASPYGVEDMSGNVWEWTRSLWGKDWGEPELTYPYTAEDGRENLAGDAWRVLRGGAFFNLQWYARCASRLRLDPHYRHPNRGFRILVSPSLSQHH